MKCITLSKLVNSKHHAHMEKTTFGIKHYNKDYSFKILHFQILGVIPGLSHLRILVKIRQKFRDP
jgi:hypothetical protein